jgi:hypothetical protein
MTKDANTSNDCCKGRLLQNYRCNNQLTWNHHFNPEMIVALQLGADFFLQQSTLLFSLVWIVATSVYAIATINFFSFSGLDCCNALSLYRERFYRRDFATIDISRNRVQNGSRH